MILRPAHLPADTVVGLQRKHPPQKVDSAFQCVGRRSRCASPHVVGPGVGLELDGVPRLPSASRRRSLCEHGMSWSSRPCSSRNGGAPARTWLSGLAWLTRSGTVGSGAPTSRASRESAAIGSAPMSCGDGGEVGRGVPRGNGDHCAGRAERSRSLHRGRDRSDPAGGQVAAGGLTPGGDAG